jgi:cardiolipin synthase
LEIKTYTVFYGGFLSYVNVPNALTTLRIVLIPVFVSSLIYKRYDYALIIFIAAAVTDFLDGLIARMKNQQTEFGRFLDPLADKFLIVTSYLLFAVYGFIPKWLTITVISKDVIIVTGWLVLYLITHRSKVEPSMLGKIASAAQLLLLAYILLFINIGAERLPDPGPFFFVIAILTVLAGLDYIYRGLR